MVLLFSEAEIPQFGFYYVDILLEKNWVSFRLQILQIQLSVTRV